MQNKQGMTNAKRRLAIAFATVTSITGSLIPLLPRHVFTPLTSQELAGTRGGACNVPRSCDTSCGAFDTSKYTGGSYKVDDGSGTNTGIKICTYNSYPIQGCQGTPTQSPDYRSRCD
jgi:hypothetical protein